MNDVLHEVKMTYDLPGMGTSEKLEEVAKGISPAFGMRGTSYALQKWARNFAILLENWGLATIVRKRDVPWQIGLNQHMFFFDDAIINAVIILGCAMAVISNFDLLLPIAGIGAFYIGSNKFFKKVERL
ncbi:MAG: hypothetical protein Q8R15_02445 [Candidatus Micrarchaeota archaeon]|nr:hypothetical protein [Candidatus Micrarchaeota archaeon]